MLKRSFAEFHAQKAQPEAISALKKGQTSLQQLQEAAFPEACFGTTKTDVQEFHSITMAIDELSTEFQVCFSTLLSACLELHNKGGFSGFQNGCKLGAYLDALKVTSQIQYELTKLRAVFHSIRILILLAKHLYASNV